MKWYEFYPSDTLFLRGAEPMVGGTSYETAQLFPPPVSVISGAIRTAVLAQKNISISRYQKGDPVKEVIGKYGEKAPFNVIGPLLRYKSEYFIPAPFTWFVELLPEGGNGKTAEQRNTVHILETEPLDPSIAGKLGLKSSSRLTGWVKHRHEIKSVGGEWVSLKEMMKGKKTFENGRTIFRADNDKSRIFLREERVGIAMDYQRRVEEGRIYMARHIRLKQDTSLIWGVDMDCGLDPEGVLSLGGEQRFGKYNEIKKDFSFPESGSRCLALSPVAVNEVSATALIASGKIIYRGGWDLAKQFHKDMRGYYPAGAVFMSNVDHSCIPF